MAQPAINSVEHKTLRSTQYVFANMGDKLDEHVHDEATAHVSVVLRGAFTVLFPTQPAIEMKVGDSTYLGPHIPHSIVAKSAGAVLLNISRS